MGLPPIRPRHSPRKKVLSLKRIGWLYPIFPHLAVPKRPDRRGLGASNGECRHECRHGTSGDVRHGGPSVASAPRIRKEQPVA